MGSDAHFPLKTALNVFYNTIYFNYYFYIFSERICNHGVHALQIHDKIDDNIMADDYA